MQELILRFPSLEDKDKWLEYYAEFLQDDINADPLNYSHYKTYEEFLIEIGKEECLLHSTKKTIPTSYYLLMSSDKIIGHIFIHHFIDLNVLSDYEGNIGYAIRPKERNKGYGTIMLKLALEKCRDLNIHEVLITCEKDNLASAKVIEKNHGELLEQIYIPLENSIFKKYKITL